jgi:hypothetical protein
LRGGVRDGGLSLGDDVIVINLKRNVPMGSLLKTSDPNPYCLKMEGSMVMVCGSPMTNKKGVALVELAIGERALLIWILFYICFYFPFL